MNTRNPLLGWGTEGLLVLGSGIGIDPIFRGVILLVHDHYGFHGCVNVFFWFFLLLCSKMSYFDFVELFFNFGSFLDINLAITTWFFDRLKVNFGARKGISRLEKCWINRLYSPHSTLALHSPLSIKTAIILGLYHFIFKYLDLCLPQTSNINGRSAFFNSKLFFRWGFGSEFCVYCRILWEF